MTSQGWNFCCISVRIVNKKINDDNPFELLQ